MRAPSLYELFSATGNLTLSPETSVSSELGIERGFGAWTLTATAFLIGVDDLIGFDGASTVCGSGYGCYAQVPGNTTTSGVELKANYALSNHINSFGTYAYTDTETANGGRLPRVPRHQLSLGASGELDDRWSFSVAGIGAADTEVSAYAPYPLKNYFAVNASVGYEVSDGIETYVRIDNLLDTQYQTSPGFGTSDRALYLGLRSRF